MKKYLRPNPLTISILTIFTALILYSTGFAFLEYMELDSIDWRFKIRGKIPPPSEIVLAVIDEKSIEKEGKWIWPRSRFADLVRKISDAGAKVIAFDIGFLEEDESDKYTKIVIDKIKDYLHQTDIPVSVDEYLENLKNQINQDKILADAIKNSKAKVVLGYFFHTSRVSDNDEDNEELIKLIQNSEYKLISLEKGFDDGNILKAFVPQANISAVSEASDYAGHFNMEPDLDGVVRHIPLAIKYKELIYAPLSLMTVSAYTNEPLSIRLGRYGIKFIKVGNLSIPVDNSGKMFINYHGKEKSFHHISVTDILNDKVHPDTLKDKIVMIGATAVGIYDMRVTPFESVYPGLEIHANIVADVLSKNFIHKPFSMFIADIAVILISGMFLCFILPRFHIIGGTVTVLLMMTGHLLLVYYLFTAHGLILNMIYPFLVMLTIYISSTVYNFLVESKQKKFIKNAFSHYLAPSVVKKLIESPENLELGGEERYITAFFSDVQGFTSISEKLTPSEISSLLNEFLTEMTDIIMKYEGTVDKFEGDAIIAFFGAPNHIENQEYSACSASIDMQKRLAELREKWRYEGKPEMKMRIGMCTGNAVVGNMGSKSRMDYTMIGDTVNTAARLEGANKFYGIYTVVNETTAKEAGEDIFSRELDLISALGKKKAVRIYEIMGYKKDISEETREAAAYYDEGLGAYRERKWDKAIEFFNETIMLIPEDGPSHTMLKRCRQFKENPPDENWEGVFTPGTK